MKTQFSSYAGATEPFYVNYSEMVRKRGFALVAALMMMILLVIVAVALLSLSSISLRSTSMENAAKTAKSNARLAIFLALADLQKHVGVDQSVTADASILGDDVPRPSMVGVWASHQDTIAEAPSQSGPDYSDMKGDSNFKGWLVSKPLSDAVNETRNYGSSNAGSNSVPLYFEKEDGHQMNVDLVQIEGNSRNKGAYAWAVSQAATKASINTGGEFEDRYVNAPLQAPDRPNLELSKLAQQPEDGWDTRQSKVISIKQAILDPGYNLTKQAAADLSVEHTALSRGVLANVSKGGLKTDLSLGFEMNSNDFLGQWGDLTNPFTMGNGAERPLYDLDSGAATVMLPISYDIFTYRMRMDIGAPPTFNSLRSYYRMHKHMYLKGNAPTARQRFQTNKAYSTGAPRGSETSVNPVLDRVMLFFSITKEPIVGQGEVASLLVTPVVTLWNPYNVAIEADGYVVYPWMDMPVNIEVSTKDISGINSSKSGSSSLSRYWGRGQGEGWTNTQHGRQAEPYFYCKITNSGTRSVTTPVRLEPGEVKMFIPAEVQPNGATGSGVVDYNRTSPDRDPSRSLFLKPMGPNDSIPSNAGLRTSIRQPVGQPGTTEFVTDVNGNPLKEVQLWMQYMPHIYHYYVSLEDAKRIKEVRNYLPSENFPRITEVQNMKGQRSSDVQFTSAFIRANELPQVVGVLETFHRVAKTSTSAAGSDIGYTVNPRHRHTNYTISGSADMPSSHFATDLYPVQDMSLYAQTDPQTGRGFYGESNGPSTGKSVLPFFDIPRQPMMSLGAFQGADLSNSAFSTSSPLGNSWASPYVPITNVVKVLTNGTSQGANGSLTPKLKIYDQSYLLNAALWDNFYFSSIAPEVSLGSATTGDPYANDQGIANETKSIEDIVKDWIADPVHKPLRNTRHILYKGGVSDDDLAEKLLDPSGAREVAAHMLVDGSFNVNSTNVKAWAAMLASLRGQEFEINNNGTTHNPQKKTPVLRLSEPMGEANQTWNGFREVSDDDIEELAKAIVEEVRKRGPFQSLGEFVNRRLESSELGRKGALQAAIENAKLNKTAEVEQWTNRGYPEENNVSVRNTGVGTPGWITQADILTPLSPFITVRSDTFTIRAYGDARDASGKVIARAYCEAVVQRVPDFVDPSDKATEAIGNLSDINAKFGRKFEIVSIREISQKETEI